MNSRERLIQTINHKEPDRLVADIGAGGQTGMGACAVHNFRNALFGNTGYRVKISEPYQMLGEVDEELRKKLHLDVVGIHPPKICLALKMNDGNLLPCLMALWLMCPAILIIPSIKTGLCSCMPKGT